MSHSSSKSKPSINEILSWLGQQPPCVQGQNPLGRASQILDTLIYHYALPRPQALQLFLEHYNPLNEPPLSEFDLKEVLGIVKEGPPPDTSGYVPDLPKPQPPKDEPPPPPAPQQVKHRCFNKVTMKSVEWLWPGYLPLGKLCLLWGDPGLGKSTLLLDIVARVSNYGAMPNGAGGVSGNVCILSGEDGDEDTILPRLAAAGANLERVHSLGTVQDDKGERPLLIPFDLDRLKETLLELKCRLLIVDPLFAFLENLQKDIEIRRAMMEVRNLAESTRCCIIGLGHLNKGSSPKALYRGSGHVAYGGASRAVFLVGKDPDNDELRVLAPTKFNLGAEPPSLAFRLEEDPQLKVCRVVWEGISKHKADDLVAVQLTEFQEEQREEKQSQLDTAVELLESLLEDGQLEVKKAFKDGVDNGLSKTTMQRAARQLGLTQAYLMDGKKRVYYYTCGEADTLTPSPQPPET